ncbi:MAG: 9-O-acetylesterase [Planctomycetota bacterium]
MHGTRIWTVAGLLCGLALGLWVLSAGGAEPASADVAEAVPQPALDIAGLFSDGMVLQREKPVPVWGWAKPGTGIKVSFAGREAQAVADEGGQWMVALPAMAASAEGRPLTVTAGSDQVTFEDVLVGEVWLCGGQSNMQWSIRLSDHAEAFAADADVPTIRLFQVLPRRTSLEEEVRLPHEAMDAQAAQGVWVHCTPETVMNFSAVGYHFGRRVHDALDVPVGLISSNWGGTRIEAWTSRATLEATPEALPILENFDAIAADWERILADWEAGQDKPEVHTDPGDPEGPDRATAIPAPVEATEQTPSIDTPEGETLAVPIEFDDGFDGAAWAYRTVTIPDAWAGVALALQLGAIDDFDVTYFNGTEVGRTGDNVARWWMEPRQYTVPAEQVLAGEALIAVRVFDRWAGGGLSGPAAAMSLSPEDGDLRGGEALSLHDSWAVRETVRLDPNAVRGMNQQQPYGPGSQHQPAGLYNAMIHPLAPYALRGAVWYQGESNAWRAEQYRALMPALIEDWRATWADHMAEGLGHEPIDGPGDPLWFGIVQLANFTTFQEQPVDSNWAELRDAQLNVTRHVARTGLAVTIDIGDADDIHPRNKHDVGDRLARWALTETYGVENIVQAGPRYDRVWFDRDTAHVRFDTFGSPLAIRAAATIDESETLQPALSGFTIAGPDRVFHHAQATISDDRHVTVRSDAVPEPVAVRYAWQHNPADANLINEEGLPAGPFRTDDWPGISTGRRK